MSGKLGTCEPSSEILPRLDVGLEVALKNTVIGSSVECFDAFIGSFFTRVGEFTDDLSGDALLLVDLELGRELYTPDARHSQELRAFAIASLVSSCSESTPFTTCFSVPLVIFPLDLSVIEFLRLLDAETGFDEYTPVVFHSQVFNALSVSLTSKELTSRGLPFIWD